MDNLTELPNIGKTLAERLKQIGINNEYDLKTLGSENTIIRLHTLDKNDTCINMLYALEGAIQGIRWHGLSKERKEELKEFYRLLKKDK